MRPSRISAKGYFYPFDNQDQAALPTNGRYTQLVSANRKSLSYREIGATGFEPATSRTRTVRSSQAELRPVKIACPLDLNEMARSVNSINHARPAWGGLASL